MRRILKRLLWVLPVLIVVIAGWFIWSMYRVPVQRPARTFPEPSARYDLGKTLVVYYSSSGNTAEVAGRICAMTSGDLLEIETQEPYPAAPMLYVKAKLDLNSGRYPALKTALSDLNAYDVIFVGSPVWWFSVSPPILSLLSQNSFSGKKVVPFCTEGGNSGEFFTRFEREAMNAIIMKGMSFAHVSGTSPSDIDRKVSSWLGDVETELKQN